MTQDRPIIYSFRRCPYAMRARLALFASQTPIELREILLRDKPDEMIAASPKATVPVLIQEDGTVLDESLDVMLWALEQADPHNWLRKQEGDFDAILSLVQTIDTDFKYHLDRYKYSTRYEGKEGFLGRDGHKAECEKILQTLAERLSQHRFLFADVPCMADYAIFPFIRQYRIADMKDFDANALPEVRDWLERLMGTDLFQDVMQKFDLWKQDGVAMQDRLSYKIG